MAFFGPWSSGPWSSSCLHITPRVSKGALRVLSGCWPIRISEVAAAAEPIAVRSAVRQMPAFDVDDASGHCRYHSGECQTEHCRRFWWASEQLSSWWRSPNTFSLFFFNLNFDINPVSSSSPNKVSFFWCAWVSDEKGWSCDWHSFCWHAPLPRRSAFWPTATAFHGQRRKYSTRFLNRIDWSEDSDRMHLLWCWPALFAVEAVQRITHSATLSIQSSKFSESIWIIQTRWSALSKLIAASKLIAWISGWSSAVKCIRF